MRIWRIDATGLEVNGGEGVVWREGEAGDTGIACR